MAGHGGFEAATEGGAMDRGDDDFFAGFHLMHDFRQPRLFNRLVEFRDIGAGDKRPAGANQHRGACGGVTFETGEGIRQSAADRQGECVHRWVVDGNYGNVAVEFVAHYISH